MADQEVSYTLSLKDMLSGKIKEADHSINHMEGTLHEAGEAAGEFGKELLGVLGVGIALYKGFEFIEASAEKFESLEQANAQLKAGLDSTRGAAGITFEELEESQERFRQKVNYSRSAIADMQSQLLTFGGITKANFDTISEATMNIATKTHHGISEMAIMVGKAFDDPASGLMKLTRAGVMFDDREKERIKTLMEHGNKIAAQQIMLAEIASKYAHAAEAAANVDPYFQYNKAIEDLQYNIGGLVIKVKEWLAPVLVKVVGLVGDFVDKIKELYHWVESNKDTLTDLAITVAAFAGPAVIAAGAAWAFSTGLSFLAGAIDLVAFALDALAANPIIFALGLIAVAVYELYKKFSWMHGIVWGVWELMKNFGTFLKDVFIGILGGVGEVIAGVFSFNMGMIKDGLHRATEAGKDIGKTFSEGFNKGVADFAAGQKTENAPHVIAKKGVQGPAGSDGKAQVSNPKGQKNINIRIDIKELIHEFRIQTTNITEGVGKIKELVTQAVLSAVNDSQIVAGE